MSDEMKITILENGVIVCETGKISALNHSTAEAFMRGLATAGGTAQTRKHKHGLVGERAHALAHQNGTAHSH
jgi:hypothetical protein